VISIIPFWKINTEELSMIRLRNKKLFVDLILFLGIISLFPFIENLTHLLISLSDSGSNDIYDLYLNKQSGDFNTRELIFWLDPISIWLNTITLKLQPISLLFLFYYLTFERINKYILIGLTMLALNPIVFGMSMAGRGAASYFILSFIFLMILFKGRILSKRYSVLLKTSVIFLSISIIGIVVITLVRFNESTAYGNVFEWISLYLGEGSVNFCNTMWEIKVNTEGDNSFSFLKSFLGFDGITDLFEKEAYWNESRTGVSPVRFYTFIGDIFSDLGGWASILYFSFISFGILKLFKNRKNISFVKLFIYVVIFQMILFGFTIYPYKIYSISMNIFICLFLAFLLDFNFKNLYAK
jgi:oligosaccharide repeat unit polymerase